MKKYLLSFALIAAFAIYVTYNSHTADLGSTLIGNQPPKPDPAPTPSTVGVAIPAPAAKATSLPHATVATSKKKYKDGSYTGDPADANYGTIQVKAVVADGKLADVVFLSSPNDRNNSIMVNNYAMPLLKNEAIAAQSAQVDTVSGATFTSGAFQLSLASALAQAKN
jgi:uncharacterized protein with FMN-binding domain